MEEIIQKSEERGEQFSQLNKRMDFMVEKLEKHDERLGNIENQLDFVARKSSEHDDKLEWFKQNMATKDDLKNFATKDDLKKFVTKDDLRNFATKDDLKNFVTKDEFHEAINNLMNTLDKILGVMMGEQQENVFLKHKVKEMDARVETIEQNCPYCRQS